MAVNNLDMLQYPLFDSRRKKWLQDSLRSTPGKEVTAPENLQTVQDFVYDIWYHPLVTEDLLAFRQQGQALMKDLFLDLKIEDKAVAVPVGSVIWAINSDDSVFRPDWDYVCLTPYPQASRLLSGYSYAHKDESGLSLFTHSETTLPEHLSLTSEQSFLFSLLAAPDEMLVGNQELARQYRLSLVNPPRGEERTQCEQNFNKLWEAYFVNYLKAWPVHFTSEVKSRDRFGRFLKRLNERSAQSSNPDYRQNFLSLLDDFRAPGFEQLRSALTYSSGALTFPLRTRKRTGIH